MRLLLVEDDPRLASLIVLGLRENGFVVEHANSATSGENMAEFAVFDAFVFDVMLPEGSQAGFELAERLRAKNNHTPILFLTARADTDSKILGLEAGGDDYLPKPFDFRELHARLKALIRRSKGNSSNVVGLPLGYTLDFAACEVRLGDTPVALTPKEYALLECFGLNAGKAYTRNQLIDKIWAEDSDVDLKVVDVFISLLRRKLGNSMVETVRGVGYRLGRV